MCAVEGGKPKGSPAFSGNNKPKKIFRGNSMEQSREVSCFLLLLKEEQKKEDEAQVKIVSPAC